MESEVYLRLWFVLATLAGIVAVVASACVSDEPLLGTVLQQPDHAPGFELRDQLDQPVRLSDYRGRVAVVTFLYTYCPDICPIVTSHLKQVHALLGDDADRVGIVAVSVDPERDTLEAAYAYSEKWGMLDDWAYLIGGEAELAPVWAAYYLDPSANQYSEAPSTPQGSIDTLAGYTVTHSAPVYLIDRDGDRRVLFTLPFEPQDLVHDIRLLLR